MTNNRFFFCLLLRWVMEYNVVLCTEKGRMAISRHLDLTQGSGWCDRLCENPPLEWARQLSASPHVFQAFPHTNRGGSWQLLVVPLCDLYNNTLTLTNKDNSHSNNNNVFLLSATSQSQPRNRKKGNTRKPPVATSPPPWPYGRFGICCFFPMQ